MPRGRRQLDRILQGRLLPNIVTSGNPTELAQDGVHLSHTERYAQTDEFLTVWLAAVQGEPFDVKGRYYEARSAGGVAFPPVQTLYPPLYFGGASSDGVAVGARHADYYLTWGEPPKAVAEKFAEAKAAAAALGRQLRFGLRIHLIVRETEAEGLGCGRTADQPGDRRGDRDRAPAPDKTLGVRGTKAHDRLARLSPRCAEGVAPNLWAGVGLIREGAGTALVGDPEAVAARLREYQAAGVDTVIASGYPHLEAYKVAELLLPALGVRPGTSYEGLVGPDFGARRA